MTHTKTVKVSSRYQIAVPASARELLNIQKGDRLIVDIQDGMLILLPQPKDYSDYMAGLHHDIWDSVNTDDYLSGEREAWKKYPND